MLYTSHKIHLIFKFIEIDKASVHKLKKISIIPGNITSDVSIHSIITCQCLFVPVPAFADNFSSLVQHTVSFINGNL